MGFTGQLCSSCGSAGLGSRMLVEFSFVPRVFIPGKRLRINSYLGHALFKVGHWITKLSQKTQACLGPLLASHLLTFHWSIPWETHCHSSIVSPHSQLPKLDKLCFKNLSTWAQKHIQNSDAIFTDNFISIYHYNIDVLVSCERRWLDSSSGLNHFSSLISIHSHIPYFL